MDKEELNEEVLEETTEEMNELEELTEEEAEETTGGAAGYGNVQFTCQCGKKFKTPKGWIVHALKTGCTKGTTYDQKKSGKLSQGNRIGRVNGTIITTKKDTVFNGKMGRITYPNGKKSGWFSKNGWEQVN